MPWFGLIRFLGVLDKEGLENGFLDGNPTTTAAKFWDLRRRVIFFKRKHIRIDNMSSTPLT
jgi:hypothetical protein